MTVKDYFLDLWWQLGADQCNFGQFTLTTLEHKRYVPMDAVGIYKKSASASWIWYFKSSPELARTNRPLLYFTGTQVTEKKDYRSCCRLGSVPWLGHWPIVLKRRLLGLSHSCLFLNPYLITIYELHFRIMFCMFEWIVHVVICGSYLQVVGTVPPTATYGQQCHCGASWCCAGDPARCRDVLDAVRWTPSLHPWPAGHCQEAGTKQAGFYDCYRCSGDHVAYLNLLLSASRLAVCSHMALMHCTTASIEICESCLECKQYK